MTRQSRTIWLVLVGVAVLLALAYRALTGFHVWERTAGAPGSSAPQELLVMRTSGGLLEVSTIRATEVFDRKFVYSVLGVPVGRTLSRIRVPAYYRYQIALAPEWRVLRTGDRFTVVAPAVRPSLPVAVDLSRMEKDASGTWVLAFFSNTQDLDELEKGITAQLARKAVSPAYIALQQEYARKTVEEFVTKWLRTQSQWQLERQPRLEVRFANEPLVGGS
jgi:hypothetical protein